MAFDNGDCGKINRFYKPESDPIVKRSARPDVFLLTPITIFCRKKNISADCCMKVHVLFCILTLSFMCKLYYVWKSVGLGWDTCR